MPNDATGEAKALEAVARALAGDLPGAFAWDQLDRSMQDAWRAAARTAMDAYAAALSGAPREPSEDAVRAARNAYGEPALTEWGARAVLRAAYAVDFPARPLSEADIERVLREVGKATGIPVPEWIETVVTQQLCGEPGERRLRAAQGHGPYHPGSP